MSKQAEYFAFLDRIDTSVAGSDRFGDLRWHIDCSAMANASGEGEDMYASALQTAEMILDCWREFYPQLVPAEVEAAEMAEEYESEQRAILEHHAAELATFSAADIALAFGMTEEENEAHQLADLEADAEFYSSRTPVSGREWD